MWDVRMFLQDDTYIHTNGTREIFGGSLGNQQASSFFPSFNIYEIYMYINLHKRTPINITFYAHFYIFWTRVNINIKSCLLFVCVSCLFVFVWPSRKENTENSIYNTRFTYMGVVCSKTNGMPFILLEKF